MDGPPGGFHGRVTQQGRIVSGPDPIYPTVSNTGIKKVRYF
jgi:hypothetical protein